MTAELVPTNLPPPPIALPDPARAGPAAVYLASLAPGSRRTMAAAIESVARLVGGEHAGAAAFPWGQLRHAHVAAVRSALAERHAPATANKVLAALRGVLKAAWRLGLIAGEDYARAADVPPVRGSTLPRGRALAGGELRALMGACGAGAGGRRDAALVAALYGAGLRRAEATALDLGDYQARDGALVVRGKGNKQRRAFLGSGGPGAVDDWIEVRGRDPGPLFLPVLKGGRVVARRLTEQAVYAILRARGRRAGVPPFSPHDLRRSFVSDLLDRGADIALVQQLAGHAQVGTTARYDRRTDEARRKAAGLLEVPVPAAGASV